MERSHLVQTILLTVLVALMKIPVPDTVNAGGPLLVTRGSQPFKWSIDPVPYTPDQGPLGQLDNATARQLVGDAFRTWEAVQTATIRFEERGQLGVDVTGANIMDFLSRVSRSVNPFIFDHDGSVIEAFVGTGASRDIVGFASPVLRPPNAARGEFRQGWAVFNGLFVGHRIPTEAFRATLVHEIGHFIGLDHTQLNVDRALAGGAWFNQEIPTMFPFLVSPFQARLHPDDIANVSAIYPAPSFAQTTGTIRGHVLMPNGVTGFQGANVIARRVGVLPVAISAVSGDVFTSNRRLSGGNGSANPAMRGVYRIVGLPPGKYTVEVEQIHPSFTGGSGVGPLDPPAPLIGGPEFYSGAVESNHDVPARIALVQVEAGAAVENVDIILNGNPPANDLCLNATPIIGPSFTDVLDTRLAAGEDDDPVHSCTIRPDSNSVWYTLRPEASGVVVADTFGSTYDTVLSAYSGSCGRLLEAACNDNISPSLRHSQIVFGVAGGRTYFIEVTDADNLIGGGTLNFSYRLEPTALIPEQEPNDTLRQAQELGRPGAVMGNIGPGDAGAVIVNLMGRNERLEDVYTFTVDRPAMVQANLTIERLGVGVELVLFVTDGSTPSVIVQGQSVGLSGSLGPVSLAPGRYYIGLSVDDRETGGGRTEYILAIN